MIALVLVLAAAARFDSELSFDQWLVQVCKELVQTMQLPADYFKDGELRQLFEEKRSPESVAEIALMAAKEGRQI